MGASRGAGGAAGVQPIGSTLAGVVGHHRFHRRLRRRRQHSAQDRQVGRSLGDESRRGEAGVGSDAGGRVGAEAGIGAGVGGRGGDHRARVRWDVDDGSARIDDGDDGDSADYELSSSESEADETRPEPPAADLSPDATPKPSPGAINPLGTPEPMPEFEELPKEVREALNSPQTRRNGPPRSRPRP